MASYAGGWGFGNVKRIRLTVLLLGRVHDDHWSQCAAQSAVLDQ